jgi:hypothetical protein
VGKDRGVRRVKRGKIGNKGYRRGRREGGREGTERGGMRENV